MSTNEQSRKLRRAWNHVWAFTLGLTVAFILFSLTVVGRATDGSSLRRTQQIVLILWLVAPPLWFYLEWSLLTRRGEVFKAGEFERFKFAQELASKVWLAIAGALAALYLGQFPGF